ncbi:unnamed protein product [Ceutorhynchus assimilis]|uniref:Uncharacterized protein n=1 Tax=Ceutorhynchus assimilis TaxID=467358 RepID=A0A9N9MH75_9CUCU|nr:unnamed protein product [Ceutorhynchus assimilis]
MNRTGNKKNQAAEQVVFAVMNGANSNNPVLNKIPGHIEVGPSSATEVVSCDAQTSNANPERIMQRIEDNRKKILNILKEQEMETIFPTYLSDLLAYNGYINYETISLLEESEIKKLEGFAREILPKLLRSEEEKDLLYGIFAKETTLFYIVDGDKKMLELLREKCKLHMKGKTSLKNKSSDSFTEKPSEKLRKEKNIHRDESSDERLRENDHCSDKKHRNSVDLIKSIVRSYQYKFIMNLDEKDRGNALSLIDSTAIEIRDQIAYVKCCLCDFKSKAYNESDNNKRIWVLSNVNRHFKTHFRGNKSFAKKGQTSSFGQKKINFFFQKTLPLEPELEPLDEALASTSAEPEAEPHIPVYDNESQDDDDIAILDSATSSPTATSHASNKSNPDKEEEALEVAPENLSRFTTEEKGTEDLPIEISKNEHRSRIQKTIKKLELTFDPGQTKITRYFEICEKIRLQINENPAINNEILTSVRIFTDNVGSNRNNNQDHNTTTPQSFFEMIKASVAKNIKGKTSRANRYSEELKKLCLYLFLISGRLAYETLVSNIPNGPPSISTLSRELSDIPRLGEGKIAIRELKLFMERRNYPLHIFISEDQTAIAKVSMDSPVLIQDTIHIGTKLKTRLLNSNIVLKMGNLEVSKEHLANLIKNVSKDKKILCSSFLDSDKFVFPHEKSIRLGTQQVANDEENVPSSHELFAVIEEAKEKVLNDCHSLGMTLSDTIQTTPFEQENQENCCLLVDNSETNSVKDPNLEDRDDIEREKSIFEEFGDSEINIKDFSDKKTGYRSIHD